MWLEIAIFSILASISSAQYLYSVDLSVPTTLSQLQCLQNAKYTNLFVRGFKPSGSGEVDSDGLNTYKTVQSNKLSMGVNVYMEPFVGANRTGAQQVDMLYQALITNGITIRRMYVQVTMEHPWFLNHNDNVNFLTSLLLRARQLGILIGIYTSSSDWNTITGNLRTLPISDVQLWYYSVYWSGVTGETTPDFDDFLAFGPFDKSSVAVKQFAQSEVLCGLNVNRDVYLRG